MRRGEVWLINLDPIIGAEIKKTRPAVIVNDDAVGILPLKRLWEQTSFGISSPESLTSSVAGLACMRTNSLKLAKQHLGNWNSMQRNGARMPLSALT